MRYVVGLFDSAQQADLAVRALEELDVTASNISIVTPAAQDAEAYIADGTDEGAEDGTGVGIAAGGLAGLLAGAATLAIPGVGPALGIGWLVAAGLGAITGGALGGVAGGIIGAMQGSGISEADAHVYAEAVRRGSTLVMVRVDEDQADAVEEVLSRSHSVDATLRRSEFEAGGWRGFSAN